MWYNSTVNSIQNPKLLFLDFDGVLNSYEDTRKTLRTPEWAGDWRYVWVDNKKTAKLAPLLADDDFRIVISSTWRQSWDRSDLARILNEGCKGLGERIIGTTPQVELASRGQEIGLWLTEKAHDGPYVILDDDFNILPKQRPYFVHTDFRVGVTDADVQKVQKLLQLTGVQAK